MSESLESLLDRWAERELIRLHSRAMILPEQTYRWAPGATGRLRPVAQGVCWEKSTAAPEPRYIDEFGMAMRGISKLDQALIVSCHFAGFGMLTELHVLKEGDGEWIKLLKISRLPTKQLSQHVSASYLALLQAWIPRRREWDRMRREEREALL